MGDNYITKKVRFISLKRDTPSGPELRLYQILSEYSQTSLPRTHLFWITAYLEVKIWFLF